MLWPAPGFRSQFGFFPRARSRRGLSLIELLAATVISLVVMGATVQLFGTVGAQISNGRSNIELGDRVRSAIERLRRDLGGVTVDMRTWNRPEDASGYFEIVKGLQNYWDKADLSQPSAMTTPGATLSGYTTPPFNANGGGGIGDGLFFTTRSRDLPFVGRAVNTSNQNITLESQVAEVAWYLQPTLNASGTATIPPTYTLYRRQFLVLPGVGSNVATGTPPSILATNNPSNPSAQIQTYYDYYSGVSSGTVPRCDISAHPDGVNTWEAQSPATPTTMVLNSLADLSYRENRFAHFFAPASGNATNLFGNTAFGGGTAPFPIVTNQVKPFPATPAADPNLRYGEDVVLANVLSFDVKVWDAGAEVKQTNPASVSATNPLVQYVPSDPGYGSAVSFNPPVYGAYVDLDWNGSAITNPPGAPPCYFAGPSYGNGQKSYLPTSTSTSASYYDTWSTGYEAWLYNAGSGPPQTSNQSFNGYDDGATPASGVDGVSERLTCPPYPVPLRGVQIKIRTYEFTSKQVREVTIQENFVPD